MVIQDFFTKFIVIRPLRAADGPKIWQVLDQDVISVYGCPAVVHTDNGTEFVNKYIDDRLKKYGIEHSVIPPYWARANPVERLNSQVKTMIKAFLHDDHRLWDEHLPEFCFAVNNSIHDSSRFSPFFLNYGRNPIPPFSIQNMDIPRKKSISTDPKVWADRMLRLEAYHDLIRRFLFKASVKHAKYYNKGRKKVKFQVGDKIMKREHHLSSGGKRFSAKLARPFSGPHNVSKKISPNVYEIETPTGHQLPMVHVNYMKPFSCDINISTCNGLSDNKVFAFQMAPSFSENSEFYVAFLKEFGIWVRLRDYEILLYEHS